MLGQCFEVVTFDNIFTVIKANIWKKKTLIQSKLSIIVIVICDYSNEVIISEIVIENLEE